MTKPLRLTLLGSPRLWLDDQPLTEFATNKAQALLFYLSVTGQPYSRDALATLLWDEMSDTQAKKNLRTVLPDLRRLLSDHMQIERQTVAFNCASSYSLDVEELRRALAPRPSPSAVAVRQAAVDLYQGEFLHGFYVRDAPAFEAWVLEQREQIHTLVVNALTGLVNEYFQGGDEASALTANRRLLGLEPWSEPTHRQQMFLLAQTGQRAAALAQYESCRRMLAAEFGIEPLAETTALYEQIRSHSGDVEGKKQATEARDLPTAEIRSTPQVKADSATHAQEHLQTPPNLLHVQVMGHNLPHRTKLFGRQAELASLHKWVGEEGCHLVGIFGIGGQGKTTLAATFVQQVSKVTPPHQGFTHIIWQSLLNAPPLAEVMQGWFYLLSDKTATALPSSLDQQLRQLLEYLRNQRCLFVLDNLESILQGDEQSSETSGHYRAGYEAYGQLIQLLAAGRHRSCLLLTSRERPQELYHLEDDTPTVRTLSLAGLSADAGSQILAARGLADDPAHLRDLVQHYSGNPLALKLAAETVQDIFDGEIAAFLQADTLVFDDIRHMLDQQFARLSPLERELMIWMAIVREALPFTLLRDLLAQPPAPRKVLEAIRSLQRRSLLEKYDDGFGLQNVVLEYVTALLVETIASELLGELDDTLREVPNAEGAAKRHHPAISSYLNRYALVLAQSKEYVRSSQVRLLLEPVAERLVAHLGDTGATQQVQRIFVNLGRATPNPPGYSAANLLHLLLQLGANLSGYDFSRRTVWQAYLRGVELPRVNFDHADLTGTLFTEHLGRIFTVAFSPDGRLLAAGTRDGSIHLWHTTNQQMVQVIHAHHHAVIDIAFARASATDASLYPMLASGSEDQGVGLWELPGDAVSRRHEQALKGHRQTVIKVAFSDDNQRLTSVDMDGNVHVWEVATGQLKRHFNCQRPKFREAAFSQDGQTLAIGGYDGTIHLWHITGIAGAVLVGHTRDITSLAFSPDGQILASGAGDGHICLWELPQGKLIQRIEVTSGFIPALAFSPNGQTLASSDDDRNIRLWTMRGHLNHTLVGHTHVIQSIAFHPDGRLLASAGSDQTIRLWDAQKGQPLYTLRGHHYALNALALSPDGTQVTAVGYDRSVHLWSWHTPQLDFTHRALKGHGSLIHAVCFSPNGRIVASAGRDPAIHLWDAQSGQLRQLLHGHTKDIYRLAFHQEDELLASASADGTVQLWNWHSGQLITRLTSDAKMIYTLAFSPDGRTLVSAGVGQTLRFWDMTQPNYPEQIAKRKIVPDANEVEIVSVAFSYPIPWSEDARSWLACGGTNLVHLWNLQSGDPPMSLRHHVDWVMSVAFRPDGTILASASEDRTIALWDVVTGRLKRVLTGHTEGVYSVVFTADGAYLLSASADGTIRFWEPDSGDCVHVLALDGPYAEMNITGATGMTVAQKTALKALGAWEEESTIDHGIIHGNDSI